MKQLNWNERKRQQKREDEEATHAPSSSSSFSDMGLPMFRFSKPIFMAVSMAIVFATVQVVDFRYIQCSDGALPLEDAKGGQAALADQVLLASSSSSLQQSLLGDALPVRRFCIKEGTGRLLRTEGSNHNVTSSWKACRDECVTDKLCDAWEWKNGGDVPVCALYAHTANSTVASHQAPNNDPTHVVGFLQRRASVVRLVATNHSTNQTTSTTTTTTTTSNRVLLVVHSHHPFREKVLGILMDRMLATSLPRDLFDVVVISPIEESIPAFAGGPIIGHSLVYPFVPIVPGTNGANAHMSLPIAMARFPGYRGYLVINDDVMMRFWNLTPELWFQDRPWVQFPTFSSGQATPRQPQDPGPRRMPRRFPHGAYGGWAWWNIDSGRVEREQLGQTRSNFDAALAAKNEICTQLPHYILQHHRRTEFCNDTTTTLRPYMHGKGDVFYVPGNDLGKRLAQAMTIMGEHDVMLEIAVPLAYHLIVPDDMHLVIPYCDGVQMMDPTKKMVVWRSPTVDYQYEPLYWTPYDSEAKCATIHPVKFSDPLGIAYWEGVLQAECSTCPPLATLTSESSWKWDPVVASQPQERQPLGQENMIS